MILPQYGEFFFNSVPKKKSSKKFYLGIFLSLFLEEKQFFCFRNERFFQAFLEKKNSKGI